MGQNINRELILNNIISNINRKMKEKNLTYVSLASATNINVSTLSKILNRKMKLSLEHLLTICDALKIQPQSLFDSVPNYIDNQCGLFCSNVFDNNETLIRNPRHFTFNGYVGYTFHVYFYSTISSETALMHGILKFEASEDMKYCKVTFDLDTRKKDQNNNSIVKSYFGELLISLSMRCCYCILMNPITGELCFLNFRHIFLFSQPLVCRVATALTTSSGESKLPTIHRALISRTELNFTDENNSNINYLQGQLKLNNSNIIIEKDIFNDEMENILSNKDISANVKKLIQNIPTKDDLKECYIIDEAQIRSCNYSDYEKIMTINILRNLSLSPKYSKISPKTDEFFYKYLMEIEQQ